jgi:hypothetical protein
MILKCMAFLVAALVLANCCISGSGCGAPPGSPVAWDGLVAAPAEDTKPIELRPNKPRAKRESIGGPRESAGAQQNGKVQPRDSWEQQQATDKDEEIRLKRKLIICSNCVAPESSRDGATASAAH